MFAAFIILSVAIVASFLFCAFSVRQTKTSTEDLVVEYFDSLYRKLGGTFCEARYQFEAWEESNRATTLRVLTGMKRLGLDIDDIEKFMDTPIENLDISKELVVKLLKKGIRKISDASVHPKALLKAGLTMSEIEDLNAAIAEI